VWIETIRIEGGFLNGFCQTLSPGLNVFIGGRGTGKSSVIELIRFCLGAQSVSDAAGKEALEHALGVLGDGKIVVTLRDGEDRIEVSRIATGQAETLPSLAFRPLVFSQKEIEQIGGRSQSRLRLVDGFLPAKVDSRDRKEPLRARISSITTEIRSLLNEVDDIQEKLIVVAKLEEKLADLQKESVAQTEKSADLDVLRKRLDILSSRANAANVSAKSNESSANQLTEWCEDLKSRIEWMPSIEHWPSDPNKPGQQTELLRRQNTAFQKLETSLAEFAQIAKDLTRLRDQANIKKSLVDAEARELRQQIEEKQLGASELDRQLAIVKQKLSSLRALATVQNDRLNRIRRLNEQRQDAVDEMLSETLAITSRRQDVSAKLSTSLAPDIRVTVHPLSDYREYLSTVNGALRGSGLRYRELADRIVEIFSPQEIAMLSEKRDVASIGLALGISPERSHRLAESLRSEAGIDLLTTEAGDEVTIELLDGANFKSTDFVSMGQRCTAILPIILQHDERIIVLDQPEDHLDNAFVVETLVKAIRARRSSAQTIVATHNPNIPVLGDADWVAHLDSDGERCFVQVSGGLEETAIVNSITTIMEGGIEAFNKRAMFYGEKA
jgi:AAA domain, putative AbiEii toxin, Type IV TA system